MPSGELRTHNIEEKAALVGALAQVCIASNRFGMKVDDLEAMAQTFIHFLQGYTMEQILRALRQFVTDPNERTGLPEPKDIIRIIDPPAPKFRPDFHFYASIRKREQAGDRLTSQEEEYLEKHENYLLKGE